MMRTVSFTFQVIVITQIRTWKDESLIPGPRTSCIIEGKDISRDAHSKDLETETVLDYFYEAQVQLQCLHYR